MSSTNAIDIEQLKERYREERDKRLRADGNNQYIRIEGQLSHYLEDPYTPVTPREPKTDHVTFTFIGGGFAGLVTGARLKECGVNDVRIVEKGGDFGGTWYWNRYPGAQCDTPPLSICLYSRKPATCRPKSTRTLPRSGPTAATSGSNLVSTTTRSFTPKSIDSLGSQKKNAGK